MGRKKFVGDCFPWVEHHSGGREAEMALKPVLKMMMRSSSLQPWRTRMWTIAGTPCGSQAGDENQEIFMDAPLKAVSLELHVTGITVPGAIWTSGGKALKEVVKE